MSCNDPWYKCRDRLKQSAGATETQSAAAFSGMAETPYPLRVQMASGAAAARTYDTLSELEEAGGSFLDRGAAGGVKCPKCGQRVEDGTWVCPQCRKRLRSTGWPPADMAISMGYHPLRNPIVLNIFARYVKAILGERRLLQMAGEDATAGTDLKGSMEINPMALGTSASIGDNLAAAWGMLEHEMGHDRFTPLEVFQRMLRHSGHCPNCAIPVEPGQTCPRCGEYQRPTQDPLGEAATAQLPHIWNILEDGRMERVLQGDDPYAGRLVAVARYLVMVDRFSEDSPWDKRLSRYERLGQLMTFEAIPSTTIPAELLDKLNDQDRQLWDQELFPRVQEAMAADAARCEEIAKEIATILEQQGIITPRSRLPQWLSQGIQEGSMQGSAGADGSAAKPPKTVVVQDPDGSLAQALREMGQQGGGDGQGGITVEVRGASGGAEGGAAGGRPDVIVESPAQAGEEGQTGGAGQQAGEQGQQAGAGQQKCPECGGFLDSDGHCPRCGGAGLQQEGDDDWVMDDGSWEQSLREAAQQAGEQGQQAGGGAGGQQQAGEQGQQAGGGAGGQQQASEQGQQAGEEEGGLWDDLSDWAGEAGERPGQQAAPQGEAGEGEWDWSEDWGEGDDAVWGEDDEALWGDALGEEAGEWEDEFGGEEGQEGDGGHSAGSGHAPPSWADSTFDPTVAGSMSVVQADVFRQYGSGIVKHARSMRKSLARKVADMREGDMVVPSPSGSEVIELQTFRVQGGQNQAWRASYETLKDVARRLALRLKRAQQEVERDKYLEEKGRLDRTRLSQAAKRDRNVFMRHGPGRGQSMAFSFATDISGSMGGQITQLQLSLAMMGQALDELDIPYEVVAFDHGPVQVLKAWDDPRLASEQIDSLGSRGGTGYRQPLARAALSLTSREEKKKVMLFLSDGAPGEDKAMLRREYAEAMRREGIIVVPMLFDDSPPPRRGDPNATTNWWSQQNASAMDQIWGAGEWIQVSDLRQLPNVLMGFLQKTLVDRR